MGLTVMHDGSEQLHYNDPAIPIYVRMGNLVDFHNLSALCHWHEEVELLIPVRGYLKYNINGTLVSFGEGDALFVNSRQMHYGFSADGSDCTYLVVAFRPQLLCANMEIQNRFVLPVLTSQALPYLILHRSEEAHRPLFDALERIQWLYQVQLPGYEMEAVGSLYQLWQGLYALSGDKIADAITADSNLLVQKRMLEFIRTHYSEKISVDAIAASGGVCRTKCWELFKKYLGQTPNDYLNSFRLEKGMQLLKSTRLSVTDIASECGFGSGSYFTELFTRAKGCSPTQYRKRS